MGKTADINAISKAVDEMKGLYKKFLATNGNSSLRISNKEFNLWIVKTLIEQDGRIIRLESTVKLLVVILGGLVIKVMVF